MDSAGEAALRSGAELWSRAIRAEMRPAPRASPTSGFAHSIVAAPGTSQDLALLIAYEYGAELLVSVGTPQSLVEFLGKGRAGMSSTFLTRLLVGDALIDASGVSRLHPDGPPSLIRRANYRGKPVLFPLGAVLLVAAGAALAADTEPLARLPRRASACLGLIDDLAGGAPRGCADTPRALAPRRALDRRDQGAGTVALAAYALAGGVTSAPEYVAGGRRARRWRRTWATCSTPARAARRRRWR